MEGAQDKTNIWFALCDSAISTTWTWDGVHDYVFLGFVCVFAPVFASSKCCVAQNSPLSSTT